MRVPTGYDEFRCIGPECEDTCCSAWNITFDRELYHRLKSNQHALLKKMFRLHVKRNEHPTAKNSDFGTIERRSDGSCSFHGDDKLCSIHKTLGESWLPQVCATYPRAAVEINNKHEASLSVSCPEAARVLLGRREPMQFSERPNDVRLTTAPRRNIDLGNNPISLWVDETRTLCIGILQCRKYPIDTRLILLGEFLTAAELLVKNGCENQFPELMTSIRRYIGGDLDYMTPFAEYRGNIEFKLGVLEASLTHLLNGQSRRRLRKMVESSIRGLGVMIDGNNIASKIPETNYRAVFASHGEALFITNAHVLENYLVNHAVMSSFPFGAGVCDRMGDHYRGLVVNYCLIKFILVGLSATLAGNGEREMIAVIQSFSRWADHAPGELFALHQMLNSHGWNTFAAMAMLLLEAESHP